MKEIPLVENGRRSEYVALVDDEDYDKVKDIKWLLVKQARLMYARNPSVGFMHTIIMNNQRGVDHINHNGLDNRKCNLRLATQSQNGGNSRKTKRSTSSQYKGVCWDKQPNKWKASVMFHRKHIHIGHFHDEVEAARAYNEKAIELFGDRALLNEV